MNNWSANASGLRFLVQRDKIIRINWSADARKVVGPQHLFLNSRSNCLM